MNKNILGWGCALLLATTLSGQAALVSIINYDADPDNNLGTAAPSPTTQGWNTAGTNQLSTPDNTGWRLDDVSTSQNPRVTYGLTPTELQNMYDNGWEMTTAVRFQSGGGFFGWGTTVASDPGWGLTTRERVAFTLDEPTSGDLRIRHLRAGGAHALVATVTGGVGSYVDIRVVGDAQSQNFEVFVNGSSSYSSTIADGGSNSSSDNTMQFASGSTGGTGRQHDWAGMELAYVPEPGATLLFGLGSLALGLRRRRVR